MFDFVPEHWWPSIGQFSATFALVCLVLLFWRRRELHRYDALELARKCAEWGLEWFARLFEAYAVGNYFGKDSVGRCIREFVEELRTGGFEAMLRKVGWKVVEGMFLRNAEDRSRLTKLLKETTPDEAVSNTTTPETAA